MTVALEVPEFECAGQRLRMTWPAGLLDLGELRVAFPAGTR